MRNFNPRHVFITLPIILFIIIAAFSYRKSSNKEITDWTNYYWFDAAGYYLGRQNTIDDEIDLTGYDEFAYSPNTLREKGYAPANVQGSNPPIPNEPYNPSRRLYTHP